MIIYKIWPMLFFVGKFGEWILEQVEGGGGYIMSKMNMDDICEGVLFWRDFWCVASLMISKVWGWCMGRSWCK